MKTTWIPRKGSIVRVSAIMGRDWEGTIKTVETDSRTVSIMASGNGAVFTGIDWDRVTKLSS